jgi:hypothetical protein
MRPEFLKEGSRVKLRRPTRADAHEFITLMRQSQDLHHLWCFPPTTEEAFENYLKSREQENQDGFLVCHAQTQVIMVLSCLVAVIQLQYMTCRVFCQDFAVLIKPPLLFITKSNVKSL